ncbi:hypothetical protein FJK98_18150 [Micromonospora sp. HM134]|uniref:hypothetical protein n=1 Tax=unclassified Micromonospora TaxID=2617518 RepID=UPI00119856A5|nr:MULTISPECIES: hypothetical protein [unclassified Micromonospora]QDY08830.1 hypothetical protein FJK98_18150 [Micromonospora sp. HM134]
MTDLTARPGPMLLSDLAREVVLAAAPQESALLPEVTAAWLAGELGTPGRGGRWHGGRIGVGLDDGLLVTVVYPVLAAALTQVLAPAAERGWRRLWRRLRPRSRRTDVVVAPEVLAQAEAVRDAILTAGSALGVSRRRCQLIAEAAYAALLRRQLGDGS